MRILASSIAPIGDQFLHIGYLSAASRPLHPMNLPYGSFRWDGANGKEIASPVVTLDVREALRLKDESAATTIAQPARWQPDGYDVARYEVARYTAPLAYIALFLGLLAAMYRIRKVQYRLVKVLANVLLVVVALVLSRPLVISIREFAYRALPSIPPPSVRTPWQDVPPLAYADPEKATLALMHCLMADALRNMGPVENLAQVQNEVYLPTKDLTPGMRYALGTYGLDGWGRPFRLTPNGVPSSTRWRFAYDRDWKFEYPRDANGKLSDHYYIVASAGADGRFDTPDDISVKVRAATHRNWDNRRCVFFLAKDQDQYVLLFHRWPGHLFMYKNAEQAQRMTGGSAFDTFPVREIEEYAKRDVSAGENGKSKEERNKTVEATLRHLNAFKTEYDARVAASPNSSPLLAQVFPDTREY